MSPKETHSAGNKFRDERWMECFGASTTRGRFGQQRSFDSHCVSCTMPLFALTEKRCPARLARHRSSSEARRHRVRYSTDKTRPSSLHTVVHTKHSSYVKSNTKNLYLRLPTYLVSWPSSQQRGISIPSKANRARDSADARPWSLQGNAHTVLRSILVKNMARRTKFCIHSFGFKDVDRRGLLTVTLVTIREGKRVQLRQSMRILWWCTANTLVYGACF